MPPARTTANKIAKWVQTIPLKQSKHGVSFLSYYIQFARDRFDSLCFFLFFQDLLQLIKTASVKSLAWIKFSHLDNPQANLVFTSQPIKSKLWSSSTERSKQSAFYHFPVKHPFPHQAGQESPWWLTSPVKGSTRRLHQIRAGLLLPSTR